MTDPANEATRHAVAAGAQAQVALPVALRSAARETRGRTARHLNQLASCLESGMDLETALSAAGESKSKQLAALIRSGARAGDLGRVLAEMSNHAAARRNMRVEWVVALAYPLFMLLVTLLFATVIFWTIVPTLEGAIQDFEVARPSIVILAITAGRNFVTLMGITIVSLAVCFVLARTILGKVRFAWFLTTVPLLGAPIFWMGTWEWLIALRQLVAAGIPLSESLRFAAASVSAPNISAASGKLADRIESGESLDHVLQNTAFLPASIAPLLGWGEQQQTLVEALQLAGDVMAERVRSRLMWLSIVLPPVLFVLIATLVGCVVTSCLLPLVILIQNLS